MKEKTPEKPKIRYISIALCVVFVALCLLNLFAIFFPPAQGAWLMELRAFAKQLICGLAGDLHYISPLFYAYAAFITACRAAGKRISPSRVIGNAVLILLFCAFFHMFYAQQVDASGYYTDKALGYGDFLAKSYDFQLGAGLLGALIAYPLYSALGVAGGAVTLGFLALIVLAVTGRVGKFIGFIRRRADERHDDELFKPSPDSMLDAAFDPPPMRKPPAKRPAPVRQPSSRPPTDRPQSAAKRMYREEFKEPEQEKPVKKAVPEKPVKKPAPEKTYDIEPDEYELPDAPEPEMKSQKPLPKLRRAKQETPAEEELYNYPPIDLLKQGQSPDKREHENTDLDKAKLLEETLNSFGISTRLTGIAHGPAVTRFELQPAPGVKVSRITSLADDIALNLAAERVRIEAPIPGKAAVGVEVPNDKVEMVYLRDVLESAEARRHVSRIAVGLGKDNSGRFIVADIAKMPHVLIAGQTGSGKSVCINSIIMSILFRATPDEVKLILIDPKVVELSVYNEIPHLITPVVTDPKKAASALDWAVAEMSSRYKKFAERGVRDIKGYNKALKPDEKPMPQMVIVIDELADLMMVVPGEVEDSICRLAQLARACGMHLVIATQRPSVNVITGIIKANIPTRIAFSVASQVDSRTMIDHGGAEKLMGNGDMLFVPSGINKPMRIQGAWVSDEEVRAVTDYIKARHANTYDEDVIEHIEHSVLPDAEREELLDEYDPRLPEAVEIVVEAGQASISMLQRRMRVGYARAGRLIDEMAQRGIVSEADGAKPRNVLITREDLIQMFEE